MAHLKDQEQTEPVEMLKALWEIKESYYPASTSTKLAPKATNWYGHNSNYHNHHKKGNGYIARLANLDQPDSPVQEEESPANDWNPDHDYDEGYHLGMINTTDTADSLYGQCYCLKEGH